MYIVTSIHDQENVPVVSTEFDTFAQADIFLRMYAFRVGSQLVADNTGFEFNSSNGHCVVTLSEA